MGYSSLPVYLAYLVQYTLKHFSIQNIMLMVAYTSFRKTLIE